MQELTSKKCLEKSRLDVLSRCSSTQQSTEILSLSSQGVISLSIIPWSSLNWIKTNNYVTATGLEPRTT